MPGGNSNKSTPIKTRVTFSDISPSNRTLGTNSTSNTEKTPSNSTTDTADQPRMHYTVNQIFSKRLLNSHWKRSHPKGAERLRQPQR